MKERKLDTESLLFSSGTSVLFQLSAKTAALILFWTVAVVFLLMQVFLYIPLGSYGFGFFISQGLFLFSIIVLVSTLGLLFSVFLPSVFAAYPVTAVTAFLLVSVKMPFSLRNQLSILGEGYISPTAFSGLVILCTGFVFTSSIFLKLFRKFSFKALLPDFIRGSAFLICAFIFFNISLTIDISGGERSRFPEYSKELLRDEITQPLYMTYYRTNDTSYSSVSLTGIEHKLKRIAAKSPLIHLEIIDAGDSEQDEYWKRKGAQAVPYQDKKGEKREFISTLYIEYVGQEKLIPSLLFPEDCLFSVVKTVRTFLDKPIPRIAFLNAREDLTLQNDFSLLISVMEDQFNLDILSSGQKIPEDCDVLLIAGQQSMTSVDIFNIDSFLKSGKNVIWSVGGLYVNPRDSDYGKSYSSSPVSDYLEKQWGIQLKEALVLDSRNISIEYTGPQGPVLSPFPLWIYPSVWPQHPAALRSSGLSYLWSSPLSIIQKNNIAVVPLHYTSRNGWVFENPFPLSPMDHLLPEETGQYSQSLLSVLSERKEGGRMLLLGSDLLFSNYIQMTGSLGNINILSDLVYQASGVEYQNLLDIKPAVNPEFTLDNEIELSLVRLLFLIQGLVLPLIILVVGGILYIRRARKTR